MIPASRTPEGQPQRCPVCRGEICIEPSHPPGDAPCPNCGQLLWFPAIIGPQAFDFVVGDGMIYELDVTTKREAIKQLLGHLSAVEHIAPEASQAILEALLHREELGSTGIGRGIAIPHTRHEGIERVLGIIGRIPQGIDFDSLDGQPVTKLFLLLSPSGEPANHLRALERIARSLRMAA